jgi:Peptidase A4 family
VSYDAWTEILPAAEAVIPGLAIHPGNTIKTTVKETSAGVWKMTVQDVTTGKSGGRTVHYSSSGASAEAIHERPCIADGCTSTSDLAALAKTNNVTFDPGELSNAAAGAPAWRALLKVVPGGTLNEIAMTNNAGTAVIAAPSKADSDADGFTVAYGSKSPAAPKS